MAKTIGTADLGSVALSTSTWDPDRDLETWEMKRFVAGALSGQAH